MVEELGRTYHHRIATAGKLINKTAVRLRNDWLCGEPIGKGYAVSHSGIRQVRSDVESARTLFREYADTASAAECLEGFEVELAGLPGEYAAPSGALLVANLDGEPVGCVAMRGVSDGTCEVRRLFVRESARGLGLGRQLVEAVIEASRGAGYQRMTLTTLPSMVGAIALYRDIGFVETVPDGPCSSDCSPSSQIRMELTL